MPSNISIVAAMNPSAARPVTRSTFRQLLLCAIVPGKRSSLLRASFANFDFNDFSARVVNRSFGSNWILISWQHFVHASGSFEFSVSPNEKRDVLQFWLISHYLSESTKNCGCILFFLPYLVVLKKWMLNYLISPLSKYAN